MKKEQTKINVEKTIGTKIEVTWGNLSYKVEVERVMEENEIKQTLLHLKSLL
jgi:hypothetical protein